MIMSTIIVHSHCMSLSTTFPRNSFCTKQNMGHTNSFTYLNSNNNCGHFYSTVSPDSKTNYMYTMPWNNGSIHTYTTYITLKKKKQKHFEGMVMVLPFWIAVEGILTCNNTHRVSSAPKQRLLSPLLYVKQQKWSGLKCPFFTQRI